MGKTLIITEKPSVACKLGAVGRKILGDFKLSNGSLLTSELVSKDEQGTINLIKRMGKIENSNYIIMFASGHLLELYQAKDYNKDYINWSKIPFPFVPSPFKLKVKDSAKTLYKNLEKELLSKEVDSIIHAGDADREGEILICEIIEHCGCKKPMKRLWVDAFTEEKVLKAFKSMKSSKEYEPLQKAGNSRTLSDWLLGAALTAKTTIELGGNSKEIISVGRVQTAVLNEIVRVENLIKGFNSAKFYQIVGTFKSKSGKIYQGTYDEKFDDISKAKNLANKLTSKNAKVNSFEKNIETKYSQPLFDQTSLAIQMSNMYGIKPDQTLASSQSLYEKGIQTYPRTSSRYITMGEANDFNKALNAITSINPLANKHRFNSSNKRIVDDSKVESHSAIVPTESVPSLSSLSNNDKLVYEEVVKRSIAVNFPPAKDEKQNAITVVNGIEFKSSGKKEIEQGWREVYNIKVDDTSLPNMTLGEDVEVLGLDIKEVKTQPPKRYTNASILSFMESCGRKFENEETRELMKNKGIGTAATRAEIIKKLISNKYIEEKGKSLIPTEKGIVMIEKFPVEELKNAEFTGELEYKLYEIEKGQLTQEEYMDFIIDLYKKSCSLLDGKKLGKVTKGTDVNGALGVCPVCKKGSIVHRKSEKYDFYGCTNWKEGCKFSINGKILSKTITEKQVSTLLEKGETSRIKGFKKSDGHELPSAQLVLNKDKVELKW